MDVDELKGSRGEAMKQMIVHNEHNLMQMALLEEGKAVEFTAERTRARGLLGSFSRGGW